MLRFSAVALIALAGCSSPHFSAPVERVETPGGVVCTVFNDTGGNPFSYRAIRSDLERECIVLRLGACNSACTMFMKAENACLMPRRRFGFHSTNLNGIGNPILADTYRAGILQMFNDVWSKSERIKRITAEQAVALDPQLKLCEE